ncbi:PTS transporter subunit EIIB, partial [Brevibacterium sp. UBA7493]
MTASPQTISQEVLAALGGPGNVDSVENCITRL